MQMILGFQTYSMESEMYQKLGLRKKSTIFDKSALQLALTVLVGLLHCTIYQCNLKHLQFL